MHSLRLRWFVPPLLAVAADALHLTAGMDLQAQRNPSSESQFEALSLGHADAVVTAIDNVMDWNTRAGPGDFRIIAQLERTTPLTLVARKAYRNLQALRGASLLVDAPHNGFIVALRAMLLEDGVRLDEYRLHPVGGVKERFDAILRGEGDATLLGPPFDAMALERGLFRLVRVQERYPVFPGQGLVVRAGALDPLRPVLREWLRCLDEAATRIHRDPGGLAQVLAAAGSPIGPDALAQLIPASLCPDRAGIELLIEQRRSIGLAGANTSYAALLDLSVLPRD